jgi:cytochrome c
VRVTALLFTISFTMTAIAVTSIAQRAFAEKPRPMAFAQCASCHSTESGKNIYGPSLAGISKRRAGTLPGYTYSPALTASKLQWDEKTLNRWLTSPKKTVPGTKMPFLGLQDAKARQEVITYLMSL